MKSTNFSIRYWLDHIVIIPDDRAEASKYIIGMIVAWLSYRFGIVVDFDPLEYLVITALIKGILDGIHGLKKTW